LTHTRNDLTCAVFFCEMYSSSTTRIPTFTWIRNTAFVPKIKQHLFMDDGVCVIVYIVQLPMCRRLLARCGDKSMGSCSEVTLSTSASSSSLSLQQSSSLQLLVLSRPSSPSLPESTALPSPLAVQAS